MIHDQQQQARSASPFRLRVDWRAYFDAFREHHGEPVKSGGRLLFPDGWTYSSSDIKGPEWPPPDDNVKLGVLLMRYWKVRRIIVMQERDSLRDLIQGIEALQATKSVTLKSSQLVYDDESGKQVKVSSDINVSDLKAGRLAALEADVHNCDEQLRWLKLAMEVA